MSDFEIQQPEREACARMFMVMGLSGHADAVRCGRYDHRPACRVLHALARYRLLFGELRRCGEVPSDADWMNAAADFDEEQMGEFAIFAGGLRSGFVYENDHSSRAFRYLHRLLWLNDRRPVPDLQA